MNSSHKVSPTTPCVSWMLSQNKVSFIGNSIIFCIFVILSGTLRWVILWPPVLLLDNPKDPFTAARWSPRTRFMGHGSMLMPDMNASSGSIKRCDGISCECSLYKLGHAIFMSSMEHVNDLFAVDLIIKYVILLTWNSLKCAHYIKRSIPYITSLYVLTSNVSMLFEVGSKSESDEPWNNKKTYVECGGCRCMKYHSLISFHDTGYNLEHALLYWIHLLGVHLL